MIKSKSLNISTYFCFIQPTSFMDDFPGNGRNIYLKSRDFEFKYSLACWCMWPRNLVTFNCGVVTESPMHSIFLFASNLPSESGHHLEYIIEYVTLPPPYGNKHTISSPVKNNLI